MYVVVFFLSALGFSCGTQALSLGCVGSSFWRVGFLSLVVVHRLQGAWAL